MEVSFPAFFELTERPGCHTVRAFPLFSAFRTFSFSLARVIVSVNNTRGRRSFKSVLISEWSVLFFNLLFNIEKHLVPK